MRTLNVLHRRLEDGGSIMTVEKKPYVRPTLTRREKLGSVAAGVPSSGSSKQP
jgi:hypothetical protein